MDEFVEIRHRDGPAVGAQSDHPEQAISGTVTASAPPPDERVPQAPAGAADEEERGVLLALAGE